MHQVLNCNTEPLVVSLFNYTKDVFFYKDDNVPYYSLKLALEAINIPMYSTQKGSFPLEFINM